MSDVDASRTRTLRRISAAFAGSSADALLGSTEDRTAVGGLPDGEPADGIRGPVALARAPGDLRVLRGRPAHEREPGLDDRLRAERDARRELGAAVVAFGGDR